MSLLDKASLVLTPNAYKEGKLYSIIPLDGSGDMTVIRNTTATIVNSLGIIENVGLNVPRLDYTDGGCPSILIEPQRTNLVTYSEDVTNGSWKKIGLNIIQNSNISPYNILNSDSVIENTQSNLHRLLKSVVITGNYRYSLTFKLKKISSERTIEVVVIANNNYLTTAFSLDTGLITKEADKLGTTFSQKTNITSQIDAFGFYTIGISFFISSSSSFEFGIGLLTPLGSNYYQGDGVSGFCFFSAQLEQGSYATSYIPTIGSAVTRIKDQLSKAEISTLPKDYPFTMYAKGTFKENNSTLLSFSNTASNNSLFSIGIDNSGNIYAESKPNGTQSLMVGNTSALGEYSIAATFTYTEIKLYVDGVLVGTSLNNQAFNTFIKGVILGQYRIVDDNGIRANVKEAVMFNSALSNDECILLTTL